ncbi:MKL1 protein, partial [Polypterus senegalus]
MPTKGTNGESSEEVVVTMVIPGAPGSAPSPQSEAVTNELQELSLQPGPNLLPLRDRKNVLQLKLQQRRTREELVSQGIMPPLKSPAAFHEQRRSLERARTEDYLKRKIRTRPERSELVRMHILEETSAEPSLQAKQLKLKRARLADDLNEKISQRPGPMELIEKNILPVDSSLKEAIIGQVEFSNSVTESSSFDEDSSDALSPEQPASQESVSSQSSIPSPSDIRLGEQSFLSNSMSPSQLITQLQAAPTLENIPTLKLTNGVASTSTPKPLPTLVKQSQSKGINDKASQRTKKAKESKPKVKKLKYHQYIPPDQKQDKEQLPAMDSSYAKILHQQQLFLQLQILNQQQQHYNYQTILPAPPKPPTDQQLPGGSAAPPGRSPSNNGTSSASTVSGLTRQNSTTASNTATGVFTTKLASLPPNLDDLKVAELKQELKLRGLPVSGTKNDLIERLRVYQENNVGCIPKTPHQISTSCCSSAVTNSTVSTPGGSGSCSSTPTTVLHKPAETSVVMATFPFLASGSSVGGNSSIMKFGSTSSTPPASPAHSERSTTGFSADEASCNGDSFSELVSTTFTHLKLQNSPVQHVIIKDELPGNNSTPCRFSYQSSHGGGSPKDPASTAEQSVDKDQMLQEKDKQIEELTRMLKQKQQLVEALRLQLEQGKQRINNSPLQLLHKASDIVDVHIKLEPDERRRSSVCDGSKKEPQGSSVLSTSHLPSGIVQVTIKEEPETKMVEDPPLAVPQPPPATQVPPVQHVMVNQLSTQPSPTNTAPSFPLEILKGTLPPALLTDANGNHFLLAVTNHTIEGKQSLTPQTNNTGKSGHITLQRLQSSPTKLQSQSSSPLSKVDSQSKQQLQPGLINQPIRKGQKPGLHLVSATAPTTVFSFSAPPNLQPFFVNSKNQTPARSQGPGEMVSSLAVGTQKPQPESPAKVQSNQIQPAVPRTSSPPEGLAKEPPQYTETVKHNTEQRARENGPSSQHMDDLFDVLIESGEISADFRDDGNSTLSSCMMPQKPSTPPPTSFPNTKASPSDSHAKSLPSSPHLVPPPSVSPLPHSMSLDPGGNVEGGIASGFGGSDHLEDFLERTTGVPLLCVPNDGNEALSLIDDLNNDLLGTSSILDHPPSPMDTSELQFLVTNDPVASEPSGVYLLPSTSLALDMTDPNLDNMDWLDLTMGASMAGSPGLNPLSTQTPSSVFSTDFLDSQDLHLHWDSCL